jgi:hypothetical protein
MKTLLLSLLLFGLSHVAAQDTPQEERARNWAAFGVGPGLVDIQVGFYDPLGIALNPRVMVGYIFQGSGLYASFDSLLFTGGRSGFYLGGGAGLYTDDTNSTAGLHVILGGDIPLNDRSGVVLDGSLGFYPLFWRSDEDSTGMLIPFFGRVSVGYRISF